MNKVQRIQLEHKSLERAPGLRIGADRVIQGYASLFGVSDQGGDVVLKGAYAASLARLAREGVKVKMLWQHDPLRPIGIWDEVREDDSGLWVRGRILSDVAQGREAETLLAAGAIDGLSIGYRTVKAVKDDRGKRLLAELELWEVSLVTFPMLRQARVQAKSDPDVAPNWQHLAAVLREARLHLAAR